MSGGTTYPTYAEIRARRVAEHRARLLAAARAADAAARAVGAELLVFGSLATGEIHERSDLDLALGGPEDAQRAAEGKVWLALGGHPVEVDLISLRHAPPLLARRIAEDGRDVAALG